MLKHKYKAYMKDGTTKIFISDYNNLESVKYEYFVNHECIVAGFCSECPFFNKRMAYLLACEDQNIEKITKIVKKNKTTKFIESIYEIAFGGNAINKEYRHNDVLNKLKEHSDNAWKYEELEK